MRRRTGSAAVEFAFAAPVMMLLLAGVVEWGYYIQREQLVVQAVRDGALAGSAVLDHDDAETVAQQRTTDGLELAGFADADFDVNVTTSTDDAGDVVTVSADVTYGPVLNMLPTPDTLHAESTFRLVDQ